MKHVIVSSQHKLNMDDSLMYSAIFGNDERPVHVSCLVGNVNGEGLIVVLPRVCKNCDGDVA